MYDLIGDIHGHADCLVNLLEKLGYKKSGDVFHHSSRQVIFLGDFIDRGPKIREVLSIAKNMVDKGTALAVMGNHELNAMAYHTKDPANPGDFLRPHYSYNVSSHKATIDQLGEDLNSYIDWFRTLPLWLDLPGLRVVHACWDNNCIQDVQRNLPANRPIDTDFLIKSCIEKGEVFTQVEILLKGKEIILPDGIEFFDKDGHPRTKARSRWYLDPSDQKYNTYRTYLWQTPEINCDDFLDLKIIKPLPYDKSEKPVFVGHYWLEDNAPSILASNVACLDYSVAKDGFLCAYSHDGEQTLSNEKFCYPKPVCHNI